VFVPAGDLLKKIQAHTLQFTCLHSKHQIHCCFSHFSPNIVQVIPVHITRGVPKKV
jgi:hypothetical protein